MLPACAPQKSIDLVGCVLLPEGQRMHGPDESLYYMPELSSTRSYHLLLTNNHCSRSKLNGNHQLQHPITASKLAGGLVNSVPHRQTRCLRKLLLMRLSKQIAMSRSSLS
jgi:hypothetical protein